MKKLLLISVVFAFSFSVFSQKISLNKAIEKKLVALKVLFLPSTSYTGKNMKFEIKNLSSQILTVEAEAGRFMMPTDSSTQRMMITKDFVCSLRPSSTTTQEAFTMCTNMHKSSPKDNMLFAMGKMANGDLLELAQLISKNNYQNSCAQNAVWIFTDKNDLSSVYCDDGKCQKDLDDFLFKRFGKRPQRQASPVKNTASGKYEGKISFQFPFECKITMVLYDDKNEKVLDFFTNEPLKKNIKSNINYALNYHDIDPGIYYVRIVDDKNNMLLNNAIKVGD